MKTNGGFLVTKIKQLGDRIFEKILSEKNIDAFKMNLIAEYADHIVYLNDGSVLLDGSPEDVLSSELLYEKNLDMPYVAVLGFQARSRGLFIDKIPTTVDEALKTFTECVQKSKGGSDGCGLS